MPRSLMPRARGQWRLNLKSSVLLSVKSRALPRRGAHFPRSSLAIGSITPVKHSFEAQLMSWGHVLCTNKQSLLWKSSAKCNMGLIFVPSLMSEAAENFCRCPLKVQPRKLAPWCCGSSLARTPPSLSPCSLFVKMRKAP